MSRPFGKVQSMVSLEVALGETLAFTILHVAYLAMDELGENGHGDSWCCVSMYFVCVESKQAAAYCCAMRSNATLGMAWQRNRGPEAARGKHCVVLQRGFTCVLC